MDIRYHGHACFELSDGDARILVDPFLKPNNPSAVATADEVDATHVLVTHGHADHIADAVAVATRNGAPAVAIVEVANWLGARGVEETFDPNLGGTVRFDWGSVKLVPAWHTNTMPGSSEAPFSAEEGTPVGTAAGLVIDVGGTTVYHAGDTCLFGDMRLIGERHSIDVALPTDRRPLHDGPRGRGGGGGDDRRRHRDPDAFRHLPADRDGRRGVQGGRRGADLVEGRGARARGFALGLTR